MIADAGGTRDALKFEADQKFFWASLDAAAAVAHGRHSAEGGPRAAGRHRLILTRRITALARDPQNFRERVILRPVVGLVQQGQDRRTMGGQALLDCGPKIGDSGRSLCIWRLRFGSRGAA
jgi:hypothetical protein